MLTLYDNKRFYTEPKHQRKWRLSSMISMFSWINKIFLKVHDFSSKNKSFLIQCLVLNFFFQRNPENWGL